MSSKRKRNSSVIAHVRNVLYTNKKLAVLLSILLASLLYFASTSDQSLKRHGLGAGDNSAGELRSALRRKGDGRAAVAIIRVIGMKGEKENANVANPHEDVQYLVQLKSHDYPIEAFRGSVCLLGGNANKNDETPLDTLKRELNEELHSPDWVDAIDPAAVVDDSRTNSNSTGAAYGPGTVRYLGTTLHFQSSELIRKANPYAFVCALYEITLSPDQLPPSAIYPRGANIQEGRVALFTEDQLVRHSKYAWGYEWTMESYTSKQVLNKQKGTAVSDIDEKTLKEMVWPPAK